MSYSIYGLSLHCIKEIGSPILLMPTDLYGSAVKFVESRNCRLSQREFTASTKSIMRTINYEMVLNPKNKENRWKVSTPDGTRHRVFYFDPSRMTQEEARKAVQEMAPNNEKALKDDGE